MFHPILWISLGAVPGALARYYLGTSLLRFTGLGMPWPTLVINLLACAILGALGPFAASRGEPWGPILLLFLGVGFCATFSTFSTFGVETFTLLTAKRYGVAAAYLLASNLLGVLAVFGARHWACAVFQAP